MNSSSIASSLLHVGFFGLEDGGDVSLRKVGWLSTGYTALCSRRHSSCDAFPTVRVICSESVRNMTSNAAMIGNGASRKDVKEVLVAFLNVLAQYF